MRKHLPILCLLAMLLLFTACGKEAKPDPNFWRDELSPSPSEQTGEAAAPAESMAPTDPMMPAESTAPAIEQASPAIPYEDQVALITDARALWSDVEDYVVPYGCAITDLDQNGRLEVIITTCVGTGYFSYSSVWEVNEACDGLTFCPMDIDTDSSQPDILVDSTTVYYDGAVFHYIFEDFIRSGWAYNASVKSGLSLHDGALSNLLIAMCEVTNYEDGSSEEVYSDNAGNPITDAEYAVAETGYYAGCTELQATFAWSHLYLEELNAMDFDALYAALWDSWSGFALS